MSLICAGFCFTKLLSTGCTLMQPWIGTSVKSTKIVSPSPPPSSLMLSLVGVHLISCLDVRLDGSRGFVLLLLLLLLHAGCWALPGWDAGLGSLQPLPMVDCSQ